jgi:hypothetical protein
VEVAAEIDADTRIGAIFMSSLVRAQLRLAVLVIATLVAVLGGLPLAFRLLPGPASVQVLGMPLPWVLLGFAAYPFFVVVAWLYVRAAERNERDFTDVVERS